VGTELVEVLILPLKTQPYKLGFLLPNISPLKLFTQLRGHFL
jgi:hypothetical protein